MESVSTLLHGISLNYIEWWNQSQCVDSSVFFLLCLPLSLSVSYSIPLLLLPFYFPSLPLSYPPSLFHMSPMFLLLSALTITHCPASFCPPPHPSSLSSPSSPYSSLFLSLFYPYISSSLSLCPLSTLATTL